MDFATFQDSKSDIWAFGTGKFLRIVKPGSATRRERAQPTGYWKVYQSCTDLFGEQVNAWKHMGKYDTVVYAQNKKSLTMGQHDFERENTKRK